MERPWPPINPVFVNTVWPMSPLVAQPELLPVPFSQLYARIKEPAIAVVSMLIGVSGIKLAGTENA